MSRYQKLSPEEVLEYRKYFDKFDLDGNGVISARELRKVFKKMGYRISDQEVDAVVRANDLDSNGTLGFDEFIRAMSKAASITEDEHQLAYIRRKFLEYDADGNGYVTLAEAHDILEKELAFSPEQSLELLKRYDKNGDGQLSYDEFARFFSKVRSKAREIKAMFAEFDTDGSGSISATEAQRMLGQLGIPEEEGKMLVAMYDKNRDGELQYNEFVSFLFHS